MKLKPIIATLAICTVAAGGLLLAQTAAPTPARPHHGQFGSHISAALGLTDQQKAQAKTIFADAHTAAQSVRQALKQERQQVEAAIQAGKPPAEVQQIAQSEGPQLAQLAGIRAAAEAKFYGILTPEQQQKMDGIKAAHMKAGCNEASEKRYLEQAKAILTPEQYAKLEAECKKADKSGSHA